MIDNIIIGIDPGLIKTGWGIIKKQDNNIKYIASGTIKTNAKLEIGCRLLNIHTNLDTIIKQYKPNFLAIEETFVNDNPLTSLKLGQARGVAILSGALHKLPIFEYSPNLVKKSITGAGKADKTQMGAMIKYILPMVQLETEDEADALSVAICHCNHLRSY